MWVIGSKLFRVLLEIDWLSRVISSNANVSIESTLAALDGVDTAAVSKVSVFQDHDGATASLAARV